MAKTTRINGPSIEAAPVVIRRPGIGRIERCHGNNSPQSSPSEENLSETQTPDPLSPAPTMENLSEVPERAPTSTVPLTGGDGPKTVTRQSSRRRPAKAAKSAPPAPTVASPRQANVRSVSVAEFDDDF